MFNAFLGITFIISKHFWEAHTLENHFWSKGGQQPWGTVNALVSGAEWSGNHARRGGKASCLEAEAGSWQQGILGVGWVGRMSVVRLKDGTRGADCQG